MPDEIEVSVKEDFRELVNEDNIRSIVQQVLELEKSPSPCEMSIVFSDNETIHRLNRDYRGIDRPTDVLSFCMMAAGEEKEPFPFMLPPDDITHLGEVIISYPQAEVQAAEQGHPIDKELTLLLIHGVLHLLGYDHEETADEAKMQAREKQLMRDIIVK